jgi:hypothetical protein
MTMMKMLSAALVIGSATIAAAGPREPGEAHTPPLRIDDSYVNFDAFDHDDGYGMHATFELDGNGGVSDGVRLEWKQGGKVLATVKCTRDAEVHPGTTRVACEDPKLLLKAVGAIQADLIYVEDASDKQYLVRTFKMTIANWTGQSKHKGFQVLPDDTLGIAYAWINPDPFKNNFSFKYTTTSKEEGHSSTFRCKVGDKQLDDFKLSFGGVGGSTIDVDVLKDSGPRLSYHYHRTRVDIDDMYWGTRDAYKGSLTKDKMRFAGDTPGDWVCNARLEGKVMRTFSFTIGADGLIVKTGLETATKNPITLPSGTTVVNMTIPKDVEVHFRPAAVKASYGWGAPWPDAPEVKKWLAALPPQVGPDVK